MIMLKIAFAIIMIGILILLWWVTLFMLKGKSSNFLIKMRALAVIVILFGVTILCIGFIVLVF